jgi:hypothetical protein
MKIPAFLAIVIALCFGALAFAGTKSWSIPAPVTLRADYQTLLEVTVHPGGASPLCVTPGYCMVLSAKFQVRAFDAAFRLLLNGKVVPTTSKQEADGTFTYATPPAVTATQNSRLEVQGRGDGTTESLTLTVTTN